MATEGEQIPPPAAFITCEESDLRRDPSAHQPVDEEQRPEVGVDTEAALREETSVKEEQQQEEKKVRGDKRGGEREGEMDGLVAVREAKKRKVCGAELENLSSPAVADQLGRRGRGGGGGLGRGFSFSFDTRGLAPIETTPRFGSFNSSAADLELGVVSSETEQVGSGSEVKEILREGTRAKEAEKEPSE